MDQSPVEVEKVISQDMCQEPTLNSWNSCHIQIGNLHLYEYVELELLHVQQLIPCVELGRYKEN